MNKSSINTLKSEKDKKLSRITWILVLVGAVTTICLVFFFIEMFKGAARSAEVRVYSAEQLGATDTSVLIGWTSSVSANEFNIICKSSDGAEISNLSTDQPFAAIHGLEPNSDYQVTIVPTDEKENREPFELSCSTSPYCRVTEIVVNEVTNVSAELSWTYEGIDPGFTVVAYVLDENGKRIITNDKITVSQGNEKKCALNNLFSDLTYTVCIIPNTKYSDACKTSFTTLYKNNNYNDINIIRYVVCTYESDNTSRVHSVKELERGEMYKTSLVYYGNAQAEDKVAFTVYITDENSRLISAAVTPDVSLNPENKAGFIYRSFMSEFKAPRKNGNYTAHVAIDNVTVSTSRFSVN